MRKSCCSGRQLFLRGLTEGAKNRDFASCTAFLKTFLIREIPIRWVSLLVTRNSYRKSRLKKLEKVNESKVLEIARNSDDIGEIADLISAIFQARVVGVLRSL